VTVRVASLAEAVVEKVEEERAAAKGVAPAAARAAARGEGTLEVAKVAATAEARVASLGGETAVAMVVDEGGGEGGGQGGAVRAEGRAAAVRAVVKAGADLEVGKAEAMAEAMAMVREVAAREVVARAEEMAEAMAAAMVAAMAVGTIEGGLRLLLQIGERVELLQIGLSWVEVHADHSGGALVALRRVVDGFYIGGVDPKVEDAPAWSEDAPKACDELVVTCERRERKPGVGGEIGSIAYGYCCGCSEYLGIGARVSKRVCTRVRGPAAAAAHIWGGTAASVVICSSTKVAFE
jgi:hypothetical protein